MHPGPHPPPYPAGDPPFPAGRTRPPRRRSGRAVSIALPVALVAVVALVVPGVHGYTRLGRPAGPDTSVGVTVRAGAHPDGPVPLRGAPGSVTVADGSAGTLTTDAADTMTRAVANENGAVLRRVLRDAGYHGGLTWSEEKGDGMADCVGGGRRRFSIFSQTTGRLTRAAAVHGVGWLTAFLAGRGWNVVTTGEDVDASAGDVHAWAPSAAAPGAPEDLDAAYEVDLDGVYGGFQLQVSGPCLAP